MANSGIEQFEAELLNPPPSSPTVEGGQETSYIFVRGLGSGAFAEANLYRKTEDNSLVVWKEVNMARLGEKERRDAINEIDILFLLNHSNIITYYNHFLDGDTLLIELEYANGGSLAQKIDHQKELFDEMQVKWYLYQLTSALSHCHQHGIIHRDVKALNIFMTKTDLLKLGDFGISKILESHSQLAETVLGTPLYMSPELMKGDKYDYKTDIWALGCVLYELLTLTRTFQGTNHLRLAYEIVCGEHGQADLRYSQGIRDLVNSMLQKTPKDRPSADEILDNPVLSNKKGFEKKVYELNTAARRARLQSAISVQEQTIVPVVKSKVTEVYQWGGGKQMPQKQDTFVKGRSAARVSAGHSHFAVVTMEKEVYTWANIQGGSKIVGQLGHPTTAAYRTPRKVEAFEGIGIVQAECGEDFTICLTDEGQVYAFGSDFYGCLGCDNEEGDEVTSPVLLDFFSQRPVQKVSCGDNHVVVLTKDGEVYTWGCGEFGRLGLDSEDDYPTPQKAETTKKHLIKHVFAGYDGTFLLTTTGRVLACGSNEHNKLGFNLETSGLKKHKPQMYDIPCKYKFALVRALMRLDVATIATGFSHSAVIDVCGYLYTFGCNKHGQLGLGDVKRHTYMTRVLGPLTNHLVEKVTCGDGFTVVSTSDNHVYAWGNCENGRLASISGDQLGRNPPSKSVSIPRPIFGALHIVPYLSARHWHCILIAEKVLNQKTLKSRGSMPKMKILSVQLSNVLEKQEETTPADSAFSSDEGSLGQTNNDVLSAILLGDSGNPSTPERSEPSPASGDAATSPGDHNSMEESALPPWLEEELKGEIIPIPDDFVINSPVNVHVPEGFQWQPSPEQLPQVDNWQPSPGQAPQLPDLDKFQPSPGQLPQLPDLDQWQPSPGQPPQLPDLDKFQPSPGQLPQLPDLDQWQPSPGQPPQLHDLDKFQQSPGQRKQLPDLDKFQPSPGQPPQLPDLDQWKSSQSNLNASAGQPSAPSLQLNIAAAQAPIADQRPITPNEDGGRAVESLCERIRELEMENKQLKETVESQHQTIKLYEQTKGLPVKKE